MPGFGVTLARLAQRRGLGVGRLAAAAGVPESAVTAVLDNDRPSDAILRLLAPALDLHAADLFVIAEHAVPSELTPMQRTSGGMARLATALARLPEQHRTRLRTQVSALPQASHQPAAVPIYYDQC